MLKWLKNPFKHLAIRFLGAPPEEHSDWQDPEVKRQVKRLNIYIWSGLVFLILALILLVSSLLSAKSAFSFSVQTEPVPVIAGFGCRCSLAECACSQGDISVSVTFNPEKMANWEKYADRDPIFGVRVCGSGCINQMGVVTSIRLPYLSYTDVEAAEKAAALSLKKSMSLSERASSLVSAMLEALGLKTESNEELNLIREKMLTAMKKKAKQINFDLTTYIIHDFLTNVLGLKEPLLSDYFSLINLMSELNKQGRLHEFLSAYFLLKAKPELIAYLDPVTLERLSPDKMPEYLNKRAEIIRIYQNCSGKTAKQCFDSALQSIKTANDRWTRILLSFRTLNEIIQAAQGNSTDNAFRFSAKNLLMLENPAFKEFVSAFGGESVLERVELAPEVHNKIVTFNQEFLAKLTSTPQVKKVTAITETITKPSEPSFEESKTGRGSGFLKGFVTAVVLITIAFVVVKSGLFNKIIERFKGGA